MIKVAVIGAKGRMGTAVCQAVSGQKDLSLVAALDVGDEISPATLSGADIAVDFTLPAVGESNVHSALDARVHVVVGTTGWDEPALQRVDEHAQKAGKGVLIAPNFAISAVLAMQFAAKAAKFFESAEVIELHHPNKLDAPSGTASATAKHIADMRKQAGMGDMPDATVSDPLGARGANISGVRVHAVRLQGLVAHEEILLGNPGEQLVIRTDSFDRISFMPGVLLAVRELAQRSELHAKLTFGLDKILDI